MLAVGLFPRLADKYLNIPKRDLVVRSDSLLYNSDCFIRLARPEILAE